MIFESTTFYFEIIACFEIQKHFYVTTLNVVLNYKHLTTYHTI